MVDSLARLHADGVVDEVVGRLKTGKEAELWLVRHAGELLAAKVYKERQARSFQNRAAYQEGRQVRNTRTRRAMARGTGFGRAAEEEAWKSREADALHTLHAAGVRVPRPVIFYEGVLVMELVLDAGGHPAPRLVDARVPRERAAALYADLRSQAVRMLASDLVHGDLSPYNVLLGRDGPVVIDFPQVIGAAHNSQAERFFRRDLENLRHFFAAIDPELWRASGDASQIWQAYVRRELSPDFVPHARAPEPHRPPPRGAHGGGAQEQRPHAGRGRGGGHRPPQGVGPRHAERRPGPSRPGRERPRGDGARGPGPGPEVVRVVRPPLGPSAPRGAPPPAAHPPPHPSRPASGEDGQGRRRRRRRRR